LRSAIAITVAAQFGNFTQFPAKTRQTGLSQVRLGNEV